MMADWLAIAASISAATGREFKPAGHRANSGGCINEAYTFEGADGRCFFVKLYDARHASIPSTWLRTGFAAEAAGLEAIAATNTIRVPHPIAHGTAGHQSYLVLEQLDLNGRGNARLLGEQLAALHRHPFPLPCRERARMRVDSQAPIASTPTPTLPDGTTSQSTRLANNTSQVAGYLQGGGSKGEAHHFGFSQDNFLGSTPQPNAWTDDWIAFWRERRLGYQLQLAAENGHGGQLQRLGEHLMDALPAFFDGHTPQPSLLHGDLWGGNHGYLADGTPVIFDPAAYYGDRECDLAMTELFGGYGSDFYAAYRASWPPDAGYGVRKELYNLYHILNHANLFGGGYARQAEGMMQRLLAEID